MRNGSISFEIPGSRDFSEKYPTYPKFKTPEWVACKGRAKRSASCEELVEFLQDNKEISTISQLSISECFFIFDTDVYASREQIPASRALEILTAAANGETKKKIEEIAIRSYFVRK